MNDERRDDDVKLARFVTAPFDGARAERQWGAVRARLDAPKRARSWLSYAFALAAAVLVAAWIGRRTAPAPTTLWEGLTVSSGEGAQSLAIDDGSKIDLAPRTELRIGSARSDRVRVSLDRGAATFDVHHVDGRAWIVGAGGVEIRVVGTRFTVNRGTDGRVRVDVERGRVEVAVEGAREARATIGAGESWTSSAPPIASARASAAIVEPSPSAVTSAMETPTVEAAPPAPSRPAWEELARARKYKEAYEAIGSFAATCDGADSEHLFLLGEVARAAGHPRDAEHAFDLLRKKHRGDARAALAAFELGRLRQDALGNAGGAAEALADAIALGPSAPFREDAEARRVQALESSGATAACVAARDAYLARYPSGSHAAVVRSRCGPR